MLAVFPHAAAAAEIAADPTAASAAYRTKMAELAARAKACVAAPEVAAQASWNVITHLAGLMSISHSINTFIIVYEVIRIGNDV